MKRWKSGLLAFLLGLAASAAGADEGRWTSAWSAGLMPATAAEPLPASPDGVTLRQFVRISAGGQQIRLRLSNAFGDGPLTIGEAHVGRAEAPGAPRVRPGSSRPVTFAGASGVTIRAGAAYLSDPLPLPVSGLETLAISLHLPARPPAGTLHWLANTTAFVAEGNHAAADTLLASRTERHWRQLAGVDVLSDAPRTAVVVLGDSITDGHGATVDGDDRWTDVLAARLQADPGARHVTVVNVGISGNRMLTDGRGGPAGLARLERDVFSQPGATAVIVLLGVNDIGGLSRDGPVTAETRARVVADLIAAYQLVIARSRERGLKVVGATLLPFGGTPVYRSDASADADRQAVNAWIRTSGAFDAVLDFDAVMRDPARPDRLRTEYDSGDHLHPSPVGYRAMGEATPIALLRRMTAPATPQE